MSDAEPKWHAQELHDAHAVAIGRIAIAWNEFQENLGLLFESFFGDEHWAEARAAWHALDNDRAQRSMLQAVAEQKLGKENHGFKEICWLIDSANKKLSDYRNSGIHTPLMVLTDLVGGGKTQILPSAMSYHQFIRRMTTFALAISANIRTGGTNPDGIWPKRPSL